MGDYLRGFWERAERLREWVSGFCRNVSREKAERLRGIGWAVFAAAAAAGDASVWVSESCIARSVFGGGKGEGGIG